MSVEFRRLDEAHDGSRALTGTQRSCEHPVGSAKGHWPYSVFDVIVVRGQISVLDEAREGGPASETVIDGLGGGRAVRHLAALSREPPAAAPQQSALIVAHEAVADPQR